MKPRGAIWSVARSSFRPRNALAVAALAAAIFVATPADAEAARDLSPYKGFATWIDIFSPQA
jgi:hypothetical protein